MSDMWGESGLTSMEYDPVLRLLDLSGLQTHGGYMTTSGTFSVSFGYDEDRSIYTSISVYDESIEASETGLEDRVLFSWLPAAVTPILQGLLSHLGNAPGSTSLRFQVIEDEESDPLLFMLQHAPPKLRNDLIALMIDEGITTEHAHYAISSTWSEEDKAKLKEMLAAQSPGEIKVLGEDITQQFDVRFDHGRHMGNGSASSTDQPSPSPLAKELRKRRIDVGISFRQFCQNIGVNAVEWSAWERGVGPIPELRHSQRYNIAMDLRYFKDDDEFKRIFNGLIDEGKVAEQQDGE